jgi:hypothetical protein
MRARTNVARGPMRLKTSGSTQLRNHLGRTAPTAFAIRTPRPGLNSASSSEERTSVREDGCSCDDQEG